jgi:hypothetical protein
MEGVIMPNYEKLTVKELREVAKELNIKGRWDMTKTQLIEAITGAESQKANVGGITKVIKNDENKSTTKSATDEKVIDNTNHAEAETKEEATANKVNVEQKQKYLDNIQVGTIVAFKLSDNKAKSAKVVKKSTKNRKLQVETSYGAQYIIPFENVIWVKTGSRWPKGVYNMLKGVDVNEAK